MNGVFVHLLDLPEEIEGFVRHNEDDSYSVVLNAKSSRSRQEYTLLHELKHIRHRDFDNTDDVMEIEKSRKKRL